MISWRSSTLSALAIASALSAPLCRADLPISVLEQQQAASSQHAAPDSSPQPQPQASPQPQPSPQPAPQGYQGLFGDTAAVSTGLIAYVVGAFHDQAMPGSLADMLAAQQQGHDAAGVSTTCQ